MSDKEAGCSKVARGVLLFSAVLGCAAAGGIAGLPVDTALAANPPLPMPAWSTGHACVEEWRIGAKKSTRTTTLAEASNGRITLNQAVDDGTSYVIELDQQTWHLYRDVSIANGQKIEFTPALKFAEYPLEPGKAWETDGSVKGESFNVQVRSKFKAGGWEKIKVPAGEFDAIKVTSQESIRGPNFSGSGKLTFWLAPGNPCAIKVEYSNSFGEKGSKQLISYKAN